MSRLYTSSLIALLFGICSCKNTSTSNKDKNTIEDIRREQLQEKYVSTDPDKNNLRKRFDTVLLKFDSLTVYDEKLSAKYSDELSRITKTKSEINLLLLRGKLTEEEKARAEGLINHIDSALNYITNKETTKTKN